VTSTQAVAICRRKFNAQKAAWRHADPLAVGPSHRVREATKTVGYVMEATRIRLHGEMGTSTTTQDARGR